MKKLLITITLFLSFFNLAIAETDESIINNFINSPSAEDLDKIIDPSLRYCEEVFLKAYMRREFTEDENYKCRDVFARKIEAELSYKMSTLKQRWVY